MAIAANARAAANAAGVAKGAVTSTTQALAIAVPELLYQMISIYNDYSTAQNACMLFLFIAYFLLVGVLVLGMTTWERKLRVPGYGK